MQRKILEPPGVALVDTKQADADRAQPALRGARDTEVIGCVKGTYKRGAKQGRTVMGPFRTTQPKAQIDSVNIAGTDGFD